MIHCNKNLDRIYCTFLDWLNAVLLKGRGKEKLPDVPFSVWSFNDALRSNVINSTSDI